MTVSVRIDPVSRSIDGDPEARYPTPQAVRNLRVTCPDCGVGVVPTPIENDNLNDRRYVVGQRWTCVNGHGSPNSL
jgi:hypothetical protein